MLRRVLTAILLILVLACAGLWSWMFAAYGTEVCVRCGAQHDVVRFGVLEFDTEESASPARLWAEEHAGACRVHAWHRTGCWKSGSMISCSFLPDGHAPLASLAFLGGEASIEMTRRLAALPEARQFELWRRAGRSSHQSPASSRQAELARAVATEAGWTDLLDALPR
jgi:hypothetical protein